MFTFWHGWICGAFAIDRQSFLPSIIVAVREIHSCTVHSLTHDTLQNCVQHFSTSRSFPLNDFLHLISYCVQGNENVFLVLLGTAGKVKLLDAPLHQIVSLIFGCCLLPLLLLIISHTVRTQSLVFSYGFSTVLSGPKSIPCTFRF